MAGDTPKVKLLIVYCLYFQWSHLNDLQVNINQTLLKAKREKGKLKFSYL